MRIEVTGDVGANLKTAWSLRWPSVALAVICALTGLSIVLAVPEFPYQSKVAFVIGIIPVAILAAILVRSRYARSYGKHTSSVRRAAVQQMNDGDERIRVRASLPDAWELVLRLHREAGRNRAVAPAMRGLVMVPMLFVLWGPAVMSFGDVPARRVLMAFWAIMLPVILGYLLFGAVFVVANGTLRIRRGWIIPDIGTAATEFRLRDSRVECDLVEGMLKISQNGTRQCRIDLRSVWRAHELVARLIKNATAEKSSEAHKR